MRPCTEFYMKFLLLYSLQLYCPNWVSPVGNSGYFSLGKPAATESRYPTYGACWMFYCFHNPPSSDMDYGIFNVRTDVTACGCTRGCTDAVEESSLKVDSGRKITCRIGESNQQLASPMLYQLNYIPTPRPRLVLSTVFFSEYSSNKIITL